MQPYLPLEHFKVTDDDASTARIRDMPYGKHREALTLYPDSVNFNNRMLEKISPPIALLLTNDGYDDVNIESITTVGDFIFNGPDIKSLAVGEKVDLYVSFYPKILGEVTGGIYITAPNAIGSKFTSLAGSGVVIEELLMQYPLLIKGKATGGAITISNGVYACVVSGTFDGATVQLEWRADASLAWFPIPNCKFIAVNTIYGIPLNIGQARAVVNTPGFATSLTVTLMW